MEIGNQREKKEEQSKRKKKLKQTAAVPQNASEFLRCNQNPYKHSVQIMAVIVRSLVGMNFDFSIFL